MSIGSTHDRHIGFNNKYVHVPPQYNPLYGQRRPNLLDTKSQKTIERSKSPNSFNQRSRSETSLSEKDRYLTKRLPPSPRMSILKKDSSKRIEEENIADVDIACMDTNAEEIMDHTTKQNTQLNSGSKNEYTQSLFSNLNEVEDRVSKQKKSLKNNSKSLPDNDGPRRKSFAGMTDEELAKLETFYTTRGRSTEANISNYDFSQRQTIFSLKPEIYNNNNKKWRQDTKLEQANKEIAETLAVTYPSRPVVDHRAISVTIENNKFKSYVMGLKSKLPIKEDEKDLGSSLRVINCYISGKRYTWSSVDWYVENLAKDGDHLVIVTTIPNFESKIDNLLYTERRKRSKKETIRAIMGDKISSSTSSQLLPKLTESKSQTEAAQNSRIIHSSNKNKDLPLSKAIRLEAVYKEAKDATISILEYYAGRLQNKLVKITVELVKTDSIKDAITKTAVLYRPCAQIVSTVSTNIQIKFRNGNIKLPYFMMKYYPMPVFIVPFEFIHPKKLTEECKSFTRSVNKKNRLEWLDNTIKYTLQNPYKIKDSLANTNEYESVKHVLHSDYESDDESVTSIDNYFPIDPQVQKNIALFEELGYVVPKSSRDILLEQSNDVTYDKDGKRITPCTSRSSRRSSRVQLVGSANNLYKVKSLIIDDTKSNHTVDSDLFSNKTALSSIKKTKSLSLNHKPYAGSVISSSLSNNNSKDQTSKKLPTKGTKKTDPNKNIVSGTIVPTLYSKHCYLPHYTSKVLDKERELLPDKEQDVSQLTNQNNFEAMDEENIYRLISSIM
ncbi:hypothetical protein RI543_004518 [Arxiozyma heterogenica]|uniref:Uncharacterized protein n=1 Tax=Arxiozyma heterogenica TaxID=278026 RepID=A0AAN7VZH2_9SACH|nr:hypothetical protein RI543_004518 [Kazachstania heterogenica]